MSGLTRPGVGTWKQWYARSNQTMKANVTHKNNFARNVSSSYCGLPRGAGKEYVILIPTINKIIKHQIPK